MAVVFNFTDIGSIGIPIGINMSVFSMESRRKILAKKNNAYIKTSLITGCLDEVTRKMWPNVLASPVLEAELL